MDLNDIFQMFSKNKKSKSTTTLSFFSSLGIIIIPILIFIVIIFTMFSGLLGIFIGPIYTHIVQTLTFGLIVPLFIVFIIFFLLKIFLAFFKVNFTTIFSALKLKYKNQLFKKALLLVIISVMFISFLVKVNRRTINTILDIPHSINHEYLEIDGVVYIHNAMDSPNFVMVDNIRFDDGYVYDSAVVDGNIYHVEYLPHSKFIVKFTLVK